MDIRDYVRIEASTVEDGNMSQSYGKEEEVIRNRRVFFKKNRYNFDNTYLLRTDFKELKQLDNAEVVKNTPHNFSIVSKTDALITDNKNVVLALLTGDCLQITAYDTKHKVLSLIHAGFKWQDAGIIDKAFYLMKQTFSTNPKDVLIHLGNCISSKHYRWDENIFNYTREDSWIRKTLVKDNHDQRPYIIDLRKSAVENLKDIGINDSNILDTGIDCYTNEKYFSHARSVYTNEKDGRHITLVQMK